ncbi:MAG: hypothetical protein HC837_19690 [Chloroflexaceae bacterium]|nr:hypothetical protein [Chloroflexaceae bacterium]
MLSRRDDPLDVARHLSRIAIPRRATSLAEAQAAAYIDARLRRAGMQVNATPFRAPMHAGLMYPLLALCGLLAALFNGVLPLSMLLVHGICLILVVADVFLPGLPIKPRQRDSQNIVGTRACATDTNTSNQYASPRWRVILLAPLDTPRVSHGLRQCIGWQRFALAGRFAAAIMLLLLSLGFVLTGQRWWWYAQVLPATYLALTVLLSLVPPHAVDQTAAVQGANGALAVLTSSASRLRQLHSVELWTVALGATRNGNNGLDDMLTRYPFPPEQTLFIGLETIDRGDLTCASPEGLLGQYHADPLLLQTVTSLKLADNTYPIVAYPYTHIPSLTLPLHRQRYRALTMMTRKPPPVSDANVDSISGFDVSMLEQATRLVVHLVQALDQTK